MEHNDELKRLPIGIQTFSEIREGNYLYVDKTAFVYELTHENMYVFFSRPRRFGKSLLCSTLKSYFEGRRDLFEGLKIADLETEWKKYPVVSFDFNELQNGQGLKDYVDQKLQDLIIEFGLDSSCNLDFYRILRQIHDKTGKSVVVLMDGYDKPLLDLLGTEGNDDLIKDNLDLMKSLLIYVKAAEAASAIQYVFVTGSVKLIHCGVSPFDCFEIPNDLTKNYRYGSLYGFTEEELRNNFDEPLRRLASKEGFCVDEVIDRLKERCGGYKFTCSGEPVFAPNAVLNILEKQSLQAEEKVEIPDYLQRMVDIAQTKPRIFLYGDHSLMGYQYGQKDLTMLFFMNGLMTIKDWDNDFSHYNLQLTNHRAAETVRNLVGDKYCADGLMSN